MKYILLKRWWSEKLSESRRKVLALSIEFRRYRKERKKKKRANGIDAEWNGWKSSEQHTVSNPAAQDVILVERHIGHNNESSTTCEKKIHPSPKCATINCGRTRTCTWSSLNSAIVSIFRSHERSTGLIALIQYLHTPCNNDHTFDPSPLLQIIPSAKVRSFHLIAYYFHCCVLANEFSISCFWVQNIYFLIVIKKNKLFILAFFVGV